VMGARYLTGMADWLRAAGLTVREYDGWESRARSSGGYDGDRPWQIMWHHTASDSGPGEDAWYCAEGHTDAPICNIMVNSDGSIDLLAAGATNTNGKGKAMPSSRGTIPTDSMNTYAVGVEIVNNGVGQHYPQAQIDAAFKVSLALTDALGLTPGDAATHHEYAKDRKIDPATAAAVEGPWRPTSISSSGTWSHDDLRAELWERENTDPPPPEPHPTPEPGPPAPPLTLEDKSMVVALDSNGTAWIGDGMTRQAISDEQVFFRQVLLAKEGTYRLVNTSGEGINGWENVYQVDDLTIEALGRRVD